ncbi:MAG: S8 family serine peptidase, partial [Oscillospiraceae bacterium]|nr:S8 family serine peptidase [Oscillospiraceae bacterium]
MKSTLSKRVLCMLLAVALVMGFALPANAAHEHGTELSFTQVDTDLSLDMIGQAPAQTEQLPLHEDTEIVRVSIVLESDSTLEAGFSTQSIATNQQAMTYRAGLEQEQVSVTAAIEKALGGELDVQWNLTLAANLISANVAYGDIAAIEAVKGVAEVVLETRYEPCVMDQEIEYDPNMQSSTWQVGARTVWANGYTGAGSRVAVIDTGIDVDHQSFSAAGLEYALRCNAEAAGMSYEDYVASLDLLDKEEILSVADQLNIPNVNADRAYTSTKIPFGYNYIDENYKVMHDYDEQGEHGSHVEGIAAANRYIPQRDGSFLLAADTVGVTGIAPDAQIISMKVFGVNGGAYDSDYMAAIEDAIVLGCDSVNLSLGSSAAGFSFNATYETLLDNLQNTDTVVTISAGNSYGWDEHTEQGRLYVEDVRFHTGGSPGTYTNSLGVASVDSANFDDDGNYVQTEYQTMSDFSSWGIPDSLVMKPEITAPGGNIYSVNGAIAGGKSYEVMSGTSMAAPQMAGAAAVMAQYIRENGLEEKTGLSVRQLSQSLMMSTAMPLLEEGTDYYSILKQGAGLVQLDAATAAGSYIFMDANATASAADGKVKAELGDDPDRSGLYTFSFSVNNFSDTDTAYRLGTNLFTQDSNGTYVYQETAPLSADVSYKVDGVTYVTEVVGLSCDLNEDGVTDAADAQIILDYVAGLTTEIAAIADVDASGVVDSYDAHLLLAGLQTGAFTVPAGTSVTVEVTAQLTAAQMETLDATYPNGAYVEGYVFVNPETDAEGVACDSTHSIPVLGFYGSWTDPSMFGVSYTEQVYGDDREAYAGDAASNNLVVNRNSESFFQIGNPYTVEETYPEGRAAVRSADVLESYRSMLIRNAVAYVTLIRDEAGNILYKSGSANVQGAYYYVNGGTWRNTDSSVNLGFTAEELGLEENERFTVSLVAVPEYYMLGETVSIARVVELLDSGVLGEGATLTTELVVDNTAPELIAV